MVKMNLQDVWVKKQVKKALEVVLANPKIQLIAERLLMH